VCSTASTTSTGRTCWKRRPDSDGSPDIYAGNLSGPSPNAPPEVLLNDGTAHFRVAENALPADIVQRYSQHWDGSGAADVNGDGSPDLILLGSSSVRSRVLLNVP
jgi:hypothetical protein